MKDLRTAVQLIFNTSQSNREIGRQTGIAYNSIRRYRNLIEENHYTRKALLDLNDTELHAKLGRPPTRHETKRVPDWAYVHRELDRKGVTRALLWVEYKEENPDSAYQLSQFNHLYSVWAGKHTLSMRQQYAPGERGWVDFSGTKMHWVDSQTGELHDVEVFVAATGVSGLLFALAVPSQQTEQWIHAHCEWYEFLGGAPKITVPDNLRSGVEKSGREPVINPAYLEMADHYDTIILPARVRKPKDKPLVEGGVLIFLRWCIARLRNRVFHSLAELNAAIAECIEIINNKEMRRYKQSRRDRFVQLDHPELHPLPMRYEFGEWIGPLRVPPDYHVAVKGHFYSVPYRLVQQKVYARCTPTMVEILKDKARVASHVRSEQLGEKTTDKAHMPDRHLAWADHTPERYRQWATMVGPQTTMVIDQLLQAARYPAAALNACATLQKLSRTHGQERFELACGKALSIQSPTPKSIRSILQRHLEGRAVTESTSGLPAHDNVRGPSYYQKAEVIHAD